MKFPIYDTIQTLKVSPQVVFLSKEDTVMTMLFPVNNSDPAIITRLNAIPNEAPIKTLVAGEFAALKIPPIVKISIIPIPT
ncbi:hypothetical protein SDC9_210085 [bioreactor metagenome]|uniref:Uncharacterized protein n=1 Tax=bioreactor metagenome TaxID=1076179 RepID=A0A645JF55_9ZZZZ